jgi:hypothetical protein
MTDPRWPHGWPGARKLTPQERIEHIADRYENEIFTHTGPNRDRWFYEYPETTRFTLDAQINRHLGDPVVNKPKAQGTSHETGTVNKFRKADLPAGRYAEGGTTDLGDVWVGQPHLDGDPDPIVAVCWRRLIKKEGQTRRIPDGDRDVIIIGVDDFITILKQPYPPPLTIECKATERLNVTRTLYDARKKTRNP